MTVRIARYTGRERKILLAINGLRTGKGGMKTILSILLLVFNFYGIYGIYTVGKNLFSRNQFERCALFGIIKVEEYNCKVRV